MMQNNHELYIKSREEVEQLKAQVKELEELKSRYFRERQDEMSKRMKYEYAFKALVEEVRR